MCASGPTLVIHSSRREARAAVDHAHALRRARRDGATAPPSARAAALSAHAHALAAAPAAADPDRSEVPLGQGAAPAAGTSDEASVAQEGVSGPQHIEENESTPSVFTSGKLDVGSRRPSSRTHGSSRRGGGSSSRVWPMEARELTSALSGAASLGELARMLGPPPGADSAESADSGDSGDSSDEHAHASFDSACTEHPAPPEEPGAAHEAPQHAARSGASGRAAAGSDAQPGEGVAGEELQRVWGGPMGLRMRAARVAAACGPLPPICLTAAATALARLSQQPHTPANSKNGSNTGVSAIRGVTRRAVMAALAVRLSWDVAQYGGVGGQGGLRGRRGRGRVWESGQQLDCRAVASLIRALGVARCGVGQLLMHISI